MEEYLDYLTWVARRIEELRIQKGVSAREMSLALGQSTGYINKIESGRALPSIPVLIYICEYFDITPQEFFSFDEAPDLELIDASNTLRALDPEKRKHIITVIHDLQR